MLGVSFSQLADINYMANISLLGLERVSLTLVLKLWISDGYQMRVQKQGKKKT